MEPMLMEGGERARLESLLGAARAQGRTRLLEHEALALAPLLGIEAPRHVVVTGAAQARALDLSDFRSSRIVVKALAPELAHKTELGAVQVVARDADALGACVADMGSRLAQHSPAGFLLVEFVEHEREPGGELLLGLRFSREFGPLVTLGLGGVTAELVASALGPDQGPAIFSPALDARGIRGELERRALGALARGDSRGRAPRVDAGGLSELVRRALDFASWAVPDPLAELEFNPLVFRDGQAVALDALARLGGAAPAPEPPRPLERARGLLAPQSIALLGVSARGQNPGRRVLRNTLAAGFPPEAMTVVKPGTEEIDGVACVDDLAALPRPADLFLVAVPAAQVPGVLREVIAGRRAQGIVLVTSGLGELAGSACLAEECRALLRQARRDPEWSGPVVNGANCLGLRSSAGRVDTLFTPREKVPVPAGEPGPTALLSQSGAFAIARLSKLPWLHPRALVTLGNQLDLTLSDWLEVVAQDEGARVFACYAEGFGTLEGERFARLTARLAAEGRAVILYRAGRTPEGRCASASHTASLAGDPGATRALVTQAGGLVADTIEDFEDLVRLATLLAERRVDGVRLGVVSNAGFECVAVADNLGGLRLAELSPATRARLERGFADAGLAGFVDAHHPLDLTPIAGDGPFAEALEAVLDDGGVDVGLVGCVPLTGALATLGDELGAPGGIAARLVELWSRGDKAWVCVVDSGRAFDPLSDELEGAGVPVLRSADRAVRLLGRYVSWRRGSSDSTDVG